jgi:hypothetical protein
MNHHTCVFNSAGNCVKCGRLVRVTQAPDLDFNKKETNNYDKISLALLIALAALKRFSEEDFRGNMPSHIRESRKVLDEVEELLK